MTPTHIQILKDFRVLMLDADGVLFTGEEIRGELPGGGGQLVCKVRHYRDGQGLTFLRGLGIHIVFVSGEGEPLSSVVHKFNMLPSARTGVLPPIEVFDHRAFAKDKVDAMSSWLNMHGYSWDQVVCIGDDVNDLSAMQKAGLAICPGDASRVVQRVVHVVLRSFGGKGAIREFAEMVLDARAIDETTLPIA